MNKKIKGAFGEDLATNYLIKNKYKIIARDIHPLLTASQYTYRTI